MTNQRLRRLLVLERAARRNFFESRDPGGLTPAESRAYEMELEALFLQWRAAVVRLRAEEELVHLERATQ